MQEKIAQKIFFGGVLSPGGVYLVPGGILSPRGGYLVLGVYLVPGVSAGGSA